MDEEYFVVKSNYNFVQSDLQLLYLRAKVHISDDLLSFFER